MIDYIVNHRQEAYFLYQAVILGIVWKHFPADGVYQRTFSISLLIFSLIGLVEAAPMITDLIHK